MPGSLIVVRQATGTTHEEHQDHQPDAPQAEEILEADAPEYSTSVEEVPESALKDTTAKTPTPKKKSVAKRTHDHA